MIPDGRFVPQRRAHRKFARLGLLAQPRGEQRMPEQTDDPVEQFGPLGAGIPERQHRRIARARAGAVMAETGEVAALGCS